MSDPINCQLRVDGEMTIYTAAEIKVRLMPLLAQCTDLKVDLSQVNEMDTAGLQLLVVAKRECANRKSTLHLQGASRAVLEVLEICNMQEFFGESLATSAQAH